MAAVLGELDSPGGAVVGGLAIGLALSYVSGCPPSEPTTAAAATMRPGPPSVTL